MTNPLTRAAGGGDASAPPASADGPADLQLLIGSSGGAETTPATAAADAWAEETGNTVQPART